MHKSLYLLILIIISAFVITTASLFVQTGDIAFQNKVATRNNGSSCSFELSGFPFKVVASAPEPCSYDVFREPSVFKDGKVSDRSDTVSVIHFIYDVAVWTAVLSLFTSAILIISFHPRKKPTKTSIGEK